MGQENILVIGISIHVLREEDDGSFVCVKKDACYFYPRPPRGGRPLGHNVLCMDT